MKSADVEQTEYVTRIAEWRWTEMFVSTRAWLAAADTASRRHSNITRANNPPNDHISTW